MMNSRGQGRREWPGGTGLGAEIRESRARMGKSGEALPHREFLPPQEQGKTVWRNSGIPEVLPRGLFWMVGQPLLLLGAFKAGQGGSEPALGRT